jgi:hypothetical protein
VKPIFRRLLPLFFVLAASIFAGAKNPQKSIWVGNVELSFGTPRGAVLTALRKKTDYLVTKLGESEWVASDKRTSQAVAILSFDQQRRLWRVQKNWTPETQYSVGGEIPVTAMAFTEALFKLADQMGHEDSNRSLRSCALSVSRRSPVGPNAWLVHPGRPDMDIREVDLTCAEDTIQIYIDRPTEATKSVSGTLGIEKVMLYESVGSPSK